MNCIKCPVVEECPVIKVQEGMEYHAGILVPIKSYPTNQENCPLLQAIRKSEEGG